MSMKKVTAVVRREVLEELEHRLAEAGVGGMTVTMVKGRGEYADFFSFSGDHLVTHGRVEVFADADQAERVVQTVLEVARTGGAGDGIVAVLPTERVLRIRTGEPIGTPEPAPPKPLNSEAEEALGPDGTLVFSYIIVAIGVLGIIATAFVAGRHQFHLLTATFGAIAVLCLLLGLGMTRRRHKRKSGTQTVDAKKSTAHARRNEGP